MSNIYFYFFLILRLIILSIIGIFVAYIMVFLILDLTNYWDIDWHKFITKFPIKKLTIGGGIAGIAGWIWFISQHKKSVMRGEESLQTLTQHGYHAEINEVSPDIKVPFYKIDGEFFYNYAPFARDMSFMLSGIRKIIKHGNPKNIVINLADSSVNQDKLKKKVLDKFSCKLDKILIINKSGNVIKLK